MLREFILTMCLLTPSAACVAPVERVAFPESEYASLPQSGSATVSGQAFLKTRGGDVKTAAGNDVLLNPVTSYSLQWYEQSYLGGKRLTDPDPRQDHYIRKTIADGDGRFTFSDVPSGDYFLVALVVWEAPTGYGLASQGGYVAKRITVRDGDKLQEVVTR